MKPFFSIRIEWNPADSEDQSNRDCFSVKRSVARQQKPCVDIDDKKRDSLLRPDTSDIVQAIVSCIEDLSREAKWTLPELIGDIVFDLAIADSFEDHVISLAKAAVDGCEDDFLDSLQELIDNERNGGRQQPKPPEAK